MTVDLVALALGLVAEPVTLIGCLLIGAGARSYGLVLRFATLWGLALQLFAVALGRWSLLEPEMLAIATGLRIVAVVALSLGIHALARRILRDRPGGRRP
ncbi:MAG: hypothetical protein FJX53_08720, partial [Alphaproteobacteria bacterium]|nr:hypothetical protein [Alphaproteobacteria bacterium]